MIHHPDVVKSVQLVRHVGIPVFLDRIHAISHQGVLVMGKMTHRILAKNLD